MKRLPLVPTIIVTLAVATMIALGLWQLLERRPAKLAYLAQLAGNPSKPPIAFPILPDQALLFRRASAMCVQPTSIGVKGAGSAGFRLIAECRTGGMEGPGMAVQLGVTRDPNARIAWRGGEVAGFIANAPSGRSAIASLFDDAPQRLMLVADPVPAGLPLSPNPAPDVSAVPNPHLSYALQWFFFALSAAVIYLLALRRRTTRSKVD
ncbi:MAG TPA: SURF1 family cytochrome oxidase biogenesis protein [Sphingomonas sp.]|jgi:surfeit locus 1 family protein|uniref:SURF1 family cytochrome oxidase biogenesis protein n=1 Tax=Sphingomonas sp. TaxID=28214 RepID=UPI002ED7BEE1